MYDHHRRLPITRSLWAATLALVLGCGGGSESGSGRGDGGAADTGRGAAGVFTDITAESGVDFTHDCGWTGEFWLPEIMGSGAALFDADGDTDLDIYLVQGGALEATNSSRSALYLNDSMARFDRVAPGSGADIPGHGMGVAAADYDDDGDVDLFVTRVGSDVLLRNDGDAMFADVTANAGLGDPGYGTSAAWLDYDRDGHLDLYVARYVDWSPAIEQVCYNLQGLRDYCAPLEYDRASVDRLYRNRGDGTFEDVTVSSGVGGARGNGLGVVARDWDADGWIDLYVANDRDPAFLWMNQGDGTFVDDAAFQGAAFTASGIAIAGMGIVGEDLDGDRDIDLLVTNVSTSAHLALRNDGGAFTDVTTLWGLAGWGVPFTGFGIAVFDQDHDGELDGFVANGAIAALADPPNPDNTFAEPNQFVRWQGGQFVDATAALGIADLPHRISRGVAMGDLDGDGDIDLVVANNRGATRVLRNDQSSRGAWTILDLREAGGRRAALGARVSIETNRGGVHRVVAPHASYLCTHDARVHAGLGAATQIARVAVTWPDGAVEEWRDLEVNRMWTLERGSARERSD